jgi:hypothetical protein
MEFVMKSIGIIYSPFTEKDKTPIQASRYLILLREDR